FKIMQVTDTHIIADSEHSAVSVDMLNTVLEAEKPDFVMLTGDIVTGKPYKQGFDMIMEPIVSRKIPWALIFGNHDHEQDMTYEQLATFIEAYPYNTGKMQAVPGVSGYGNYTLEVKGRDRQKTEAVLYCMDSHSYSSIGRYDWLAFNQVEWYRRQSDRYTAANNGTPLPALAFFHIPLPEYKEVILDKKTGMKRMGENPPDVNSGMFLAMLEKGDVMGTFVGHDHANDYIFNHFGIALAYGRFSGNQNTSYSTIVYGIRQRYSMDFPNGVRIIELSEGQRGFDTWIRLNDNTVINKVRFPDDF
ncbi:MAG: metallophosphoesterase family protein, partial [Tannerella sp.]|nr:metallophosphoesterase family protein [Tannerella sp.]